MTQAQRIAPSIRTQCNDGPASELRRDGFTVLRGLLKPDDLQPLREEIVSLAGTVAPDLDPWGRQERRLSSESRRRIYRALRYLPGLMRLATHDALFDLVREIGIEQPAIMQSHNVRMDSPGDDEHLFHWHQDFTYLLGSPNAVTIWIPLTEANETRGSVEIVPHSHRQGVLPVAPLTARHARSDCALSPKDLILVEEPQPDQSTVIRAEPGDVAVFSMFALHRSTPNLSDTIRWTAQLRYADFASKGFRDAGFPFGDATNIFHCGYRGTFYDPNP